MTNGRWKGLVVIASDCRASFAELADWAAAEAPNVKVVLRPQYASRRMTDTAGVRIQAARLAEAFRLVPSSISQVGSEKK